MDSNITHWLDEMGQARYGRETAVKHGFDDHSRARWDGTRYGREMAVKHRLDGHSLAEWHVISTIRSGVG